MVPAGSFAHIDARSSLPNVLTQGKCSSPCNPGSPPPVLPAPGLCPASLPEHCQARPWLWRWPPKLQALCSIVYLKKKKKNLLFPSQWFWGDSFLVESVMCVFTLFLLRFLLLLSPLSGLPPLCSAHSSFLPQINSSQFLPSTGHFCDL